MHARLYSRLVLLVGLGLTLAPTIGGTVSASLANLSHSYQSEDIITDGSLISLDPKREDYVLPANTDNAAKLIGVAVIASDSLLAVNVDKSKVQVATSGTVRVLVSTLNGDIRVGDPIAASAFNGIGMKSLPGSRVVGLAQGSFSAASNEAKSIQVTDKTGHKQRIFVGSVQIDIGIKTESGQRTEPQLNSIQKIIRSTTGHTVSTLRALISLLVGLIAIITLITLIYASIYGSIIAVGRNPLAKFAVYRTLTSVLGMAVLTTLLAGFTIFLLLH